MITAVPKGGRESVMGKGEASAPWSDWFLERTVRRQLGRCRHHGEWADLGTCGKNSGRYGALASQDADAPPFRDLYPCQCASLGTRGTGRMGAGRDAQVIDLYIASTVPFPPRANAGDLEVELLRASKLCH